MSNFDGNNDGNNGGNNGGYNGRYNDDHNNSHSSGPNDGGYNNGHNDGYNNNYAQEPLTLTLCLEENCILVSMAVLQALELPKQVQMLINEERKTLLLQACTVEDREAVIVPISTAYQLEMSGHALLKRIRKLTGWADNTPRVVYGEYVPRHRVVLFDLTKARLAELRTPFDGRPEKPY